MLRVHTIYKDNLEEDAANNNWTTHTVATIKKIIKTWFDSNIAESILLFFRVGVNGDLHSYMPIVPKYKGNIPNVKNFKGTKGEANIICIEPYKKTLEISDGYFRSVNDDAFVTSTMEKYFWNGSDVFIMQTDVTLFFKESLKKAVKKPAAKAMKRSFARKAAKKSVEREAMGRLFRVRTEEKPVAKKAMKKTAKKVAKKPATKKAVKKPVKKVAKKPVVKKTAKKTTKKPVVKKSIKKPVAHRAGKGI